MVHQVVARHAIKPGLKAALRRIVAAKRLEDLDEDFLRQIFRVAALSAEPVAQVIDFSSVRPQQLLPGGAVARKAAFYQLRVAFHSRSLLCTCEHRVGDNDSRSPYGLYRGNRAAF